MKFTNRKAYGTNYKGVYVRPFETVEIPDDEETEKENSFRERLMKLNGIGQKTADEITVIASDESELKKMDDNELYMRLRDDVAKMVIDKFKGGGQ